MCAVVCYQYAVDVVPVLVRSRSLQEPPVSAFVVGDERLHLVVFPLVGDQHAFNAGHLTSTDTQTVESGLYPINAKPSGEVLHRL